MESLSSWYRRNTADISFIVKIVQRPFLVDFEREDAPEQFDKDGCTHFSVLPKLYSAVQIGKKLLRSIGSIDPRSSQ